VKGARAIRHPDVAAILAALQKMQSLMTTYMPLKTVNQYEQTTAKYETAGKYPSQRQHQPKLSHAVREPFKQVSNLFHVNVRVQHCPSQETSNPCSFPATRPTWAAFRPVPAVYGVVNGAEYGIALL